MLLVSYLYNISERQTEEVANPSYRDKKRILENGKLIAYEKLLKEIIKIALEKGIDFGSLQVIDSVHTEADVSVEKDERRQRDGRPLA